MHILGSGRERLWTKKSCCNRTVEPSRDLGCQHSDVGGSNGGVWIVVRRPGDAVRLHLAAVIAAGTINTRLNLNVISVRHNDKNRTGKERTSPQTFLRRFVAPPKSIISSRNPGMVSQMISQLAANRWSRIISLGNVNKARAISVDIPGSQSRFGWWWRTIFVVQGRLRRQSRPNTVVRDHVYSRKGGTRPREVPAIRLVRLLICRGRISIIGIPRQKAAKSVSKQQPAKEWYVLSLLCHLR